MSITVGIADDHQLFLKSLSVLISSFNDYKVSIEALNGEELLQKLDLAKEKPDILLLDVKMPVLNGIEAATTVSNRYPAIKIVALSMKDDDVTVINMIKAGCCAYLLKDIHPDELEKALFEVNQKGYYNADTANLNYRRLIKKAQEKEDLHINEREKAFLEFACSDLTYKQIAAKMNLAERTIDGYRESLFYKLNVQSRVGMVLEGIRREIISIEKWKEEKN